MKEFSPEMLKEYLEHCSESPLLLDVREPWEYNYCHIDGSTLIPMGEISQQVESLNPDKETVIICHHGIRSRHVAYFLEQQYAFSNVINLEGGVERWAKEVEIDMNRY